MNVRHAEIKTGKTEQLIRTVSGSRSYEHHTANVASGFAGIKQSKGSRIQVSGRKVSIEQGCTVQDRKAVVETRNVLKRVTFLRFSPRTFQASCLGGLIQPKGRK